MVDKQKNNKSLNMYLKPNSCELLESALWQFHLQQGAFSLQKAIKSHFY